MHTTSWALAAALAVISTASTANADQPRIYFPRHVKRQFQNATITRADTFPSPESTPFGGTAPITAPPDVVVDLPAVLPDVPLSDPLGDPGVTTIFVETSTIIVTPTEVVPVIVVGTSNGIPEIVVLPTPATEPEQTSSGILLAPTGVVTPTSSASVEAQPEEKPVTSETLASPAGVNATEPAETKPTETLAAPANANTTETTTSPPAEEPATTSPPAQNVTAPAETPTETQAEPTQAPKDPLDPLKEIISNLLPLPTPPVNITDPVANITSEVLPPPTSSLAPEPTPEPTPDPTPDPTVVDPVQDTTTTTPPPETVTTPPITPTDPPPPLNTTSEVPNTTPPVNDPATEVPLGNDTTTEPPPPPTSTPYTIPANSTTPAPDPTDAPEPTSAFTSVPATGTITDQESWLPTTVVTEQMPTANQPTEALAPTTTATLPSYFPKVISPSDPGTVVEQPDNSVLLQVGFLCSLNYKYVSKTPRAAAQMFSLLPQALAYAAGIDNSQIKMQKLVPLDTTGTMGCFTTLARFYYPQSFVDTLRMDVKIAYSALYTNPDLLIYNFTQQINPAIEIIPGPDDESSTTENGAEASSTSNPGGDIFNQPSTPQTPKEMVTTAGIVVGSVGVAVAYGAAMFLVARRYKRKKQAHQRTSSLTNGSRGSSGMRYTGTGSPALMGGALRSPDFSSYGGTSGGRNSHTSSGRIGSGRGGRDSHGSGAGNSGRTAYISAPVAAENSLGWN